MSDKNQLLIKSKSNEGGRKFPMFPAFSATANPSLTDVFYKITFNNKPPWPHAGLKNSLLKLRTTLAQTINVHCKKMAIE